MSRTIDSHLHVWELARGGYDWLAADAGALFDDFPAEAAEVQLTDSEIDAAVLVQAQDSRAETEYLLELAERLPWVAGVVGWLPLDDRAAAERQLDDLGGNPFFVGVRSLLHIDPRADLLDRPSVDESLHLLAARGFPLEVPDAWPRHLAQVGALTARLPELTIVIDHLAKPPRDHPDFAAWRTELARVAASESVVAKVSGLRMPGTDYSVAALAEVWELALELFGSDRLMWGSDWPMPVAEAGYAATVAPLFELIGALSTHEQDAILSGTATRVYSLAGPSASLA